MANRDVLVNENTLIAIADAIREKNGTSNAYKPNQMADAIANITNNNTAAVVVADSNDSKGGIVKTITAIDIGDTTATAADVASGKVFYTVNGIRTVGTASVGGGWTTEGIADGSEPNGAIVYNGTSINKMAFAGSSITSFVGANVTSMGWNAFGGCPNLISVSFPALTNWVYFNANNNNYGILPSLTRIDIPNVATFSAQTFTQMPSLTEVVLPKATTCGANGFNTSGSGITTVDLGENFTKFDGYSFNGAANILVNVIIRNTQTVPTVANSTNTLPKRLVNYYVPSALIESYKIATNWSSYYDSGYCNFIALEGSSYESEDWYLND